MGKSSQWYSNIIELQNLQGNCSVNLDILQQQLESNVGFKQDDPFKGLTDEKPPYEVYGGNSDDLFDLLEDSINEEQGLFQDDLFDLQ